MSEFDAMVNGPILRTHRARVIALLRHFREQGYTLEHCAHRQRLRLKRSTLEKYCRLGSIAFPDYVPMKMREKH
jgi:hypothetical protein